jgi:hypothetical protein
MRYMISLIVALLTLPACFDTDGTPAQPGGRENIFAAEAFIDAFYSFNSTDLESALSSAEESIPSIIYYQGWAEGGNYEIVNRLPCTVKDIDLVSCSITVKDDLAGALDIDFNVTDTFEISLSDGIIKSVKTSSNDPQVYYDAENWVRR